MNETWEKAGRHQGATHILVIQDIYNKDEYPVNIFHADDVDIMVDFYNRKSDRKVTKVFEL